MKVYYLPTASIWNQFKAIIADAGIQREYDEDLYYTNILDCHHIAIMGTGYKVLKPGDVGVCTLVDEDYLSQLEMLSFSNEALIEWLNNS